MFPADEWQFIRYGRYVADTVTSYDTVVNYISGVRKLHELARFQVPSMSSPNLAHFLRAIKFELAHPVKQATPMTPELLRKMFNHVRLDNVRDIVCFTAILIGFYLFLRKSNLVPESQAAYNPKEQLTRSNIRLGQALVLVEIEWSKTIQYQEKVMLLPLLPAKDKRICPVLWLSLMLSKVRAGPKEPLFAIPGKNGVVPLTYDQLSKWLKETVTKTGTAPEGYTLHGLRKGGACHALESGLVGEDIQLMGDWATMTYMTYLDQTLTRRVNNMVQFMHGL